MKAAAVRLIQRRLIAEGFTPGTVDGQLGSNTYGAVGEALLTRQDKLPQGWQDWSNPRKAVAYLQLLCAEQGIEVGAIDGCWGPQTDYAFDTLAHLLKTGETPRPWRDDTPPEANPNGWPEQGEAKLVAFYGETGTNQVKLALPYPHRLSWDLRQTITSFSCNARVHDNARRVLTKVFDHYGLERIWELLPQRAQDALRIEMVDALLGGRHRLRPRPQPTPMGTRPGCLRPTRVRRLVALLGGRGMDGTRPH